MPLLQTVPKRQALFPYDKWSEAMPSLAREYQDNFPCPHICLAEFLDPYTADAMAREFPDPGTDAWTHYKHQNENKQGLAKRDLFGEQLGRVTDELNSPQFVRWLSELTGIEGLIPDPSLEGGGLHQSGRGGFLNVHADFSMHHYHKNWRRRVNLIVYLNATWQEQWGGSIELWDSEMSRCMAKYPPFLNRAFIFSTDDNSLHGFPDPLQCPENESRKSLALYYYTEEKNSNVSARSTDYRARPSDGLWKSAMIWLDKQAVNLYSMAKVRFGFSDAFASKVLKSISGRRNRLPARVSGDSEPLRARSIQGIRATDADLAD